MAFLKNTDLFEVKQARWEVPKLKYDSSGSNDADFLTLSCILGLL